MELFIAQIQALVPHIIGLEVPVIGKSVFLSFTKAITSKLICPKTIMWRFVLLELPNHIHFSNLPSLNSFGLLLSYVAGKS